MLGFGCEDRAARKLGASFTGEEDESPLRSPVGGREL